MLPLLFSLSLSLSLCHSACALVDSSGSHIGLTVYNLADSAHFNIGDIITIPDPHFKQVKLDTDKVPNFILLEIFTACVKIFTSGNLRKS